MSIGITCKKAVEYISKKEEGKVSLWHRIQLARHLAVCSLCRTFAGQNKMIAAMFKSQDQPGHLTDNDKRKIADAVLGKQK